MLCFPLVYVIIARKASVGGRHTKQADIHCQQYTDVHWYANTRKRHSWFIFRTSVPHCGLYKRSCECSQHEHPHY